MKKHVMLCWMMICLIIGSVEGVTKTVKGSDTGGAKEIILIPVLKQWKIKFDKKEVGEKEGWQKKDYNDSSWDKIKVPAFWDATYGIQIGYAWYRGSVYAPQELEGFEIYLHFGSVDEYAWVYINGKFAGAHATGDPGKAWKEPFSVRIDNLLKYGRRNIIAVKVFNVAYAGGIYKPVHFVVLKEPGALKVKKKLMDDRKNLIKAKKLFPKVKQQINELQKKLKPKDGDNPVSILIASLKWALEDANLAIEAKMGTNALETLRDILSMVKNHDTLISKGKIVPIPKKMYGDAKTNPYIGQIEKSILKDMTKPLKKYAKGESGYKEIENAWDFRGMGKRVCTYTWALTHTETEFFHNSELFERLLHLIQGILQNQKGGSWIAERSSADGNINRFCFGPTLDAYLMIKKQFGWAIPPSKIKEWEENIRLAVEFQYDKYGVKDKKCGVYPNMDIYYILIMELANKLFGEPAYKDHADMVLKSLETVLYPMGAFAYIRDQNECFGYHNINICILARYYNLTGNKLAKSILERTVDYYPYNIEPSSIPEYYTDSWWKHYWRGTSASGPEIIAGLTGDGRNKFLANMLPKGGILYNVYTIPFYRKNIKAASLPDNYIIYDENIMGPRGRYGKFSFAATCRPLGPGDGKDTFVGCMISDNQFSPPLDSALQIVTMEVKHKREGDHLASRIYISGDEKNSVVIGKDFASLATIYKLSKPAFMKTISMDWQGTQQWLLSKDRLFGLLTVEPLKDLQAVGVHGRLRFGLKKTIEGNDTSWKYGMLLTKIHEHNFGRIITKPSETFYMDKPENYRSTEIILEDKPSIAADDKEDITYVKGSRYYFLAEIRPDWSSPAEDVRAFTGENNIFGFRFSDGKNIFFVLHNAGEHEAEWTSRVGDTVNSAVVYKGKDGEKKQIQLGERNGRKTININLSPGEHVIVIVKE